METRVIYFATPHTRPEQPRWWTDGYRERSQTELWVCTTSLPNIHRKSVSQLDIWSRFCRRFSQPWWQLVKLPHQRHSPALGKCGWTSSPMQLMQMGPLHLNLYENH